MEHHIWGGYSIGYYSNLEHMIFTFKKGKHRGNPIYWLFWCILLIRPKVIKRELMFSVDSKYDLGDIDQLDWNKIFGISYKFSPLESSARFVERYNINKGVFEVAAYIHRGIGVEPEVVWLANLVANWKYNLLLQIEPTEYVFCVIKKETNSILSRTAIPKKHNKKSGFLLGPYFGGNETSPVRRKYSLKKIR